MTTKQVLSRARRVIQKPERWTRGTLAKDRHGEEVDTIDKSACQWCVAGAIDRAAGGDYRTYVAATEALECGIKKIGSRASSISSFNDSPHTDHERVLRALDKALEECV